MTTPADTGAGADVDTGAGADVDTGAEAGTDDLLEGSGLVSSLADVAGAVQEQDGAGIAVAGVAAGMDALGAVADPLGAFAEAGVGWAIEHVAFLREPLDNLAGDPGQIEDRATAWRALGTTLREQAALLDEMVPRAARDWSGDAAQGWAYAAGRDREALDRVADTADEVARLVLHSGAMVGTERALIRDTIAAFVVSAARWLIVAVGTGGLGVPAALAGLVSSAATTAVDTAERVAEVMDELSRLSELADGLGARFGVAAARRAVDGIGSVPGLEAGIGAGIEVTTQAAATRATEREWSTAPSG